MNNRRFCKCRGSAVLLAAVFLSGCSDDERLVRLSEEAANRQAEQNREMARQSRQTAEATKELVAADAKARTELTALQQNLRADQAEIGQKRDALEIERQNIAAERKWDRLLAPALLDFGVFMMITASLVFCGYLLIGLRHEKITEPSVEELLIQELVSENPRLLPLLPPSPPVLNCRPQPELEDPAEDSPVSKT